MEDTNLCVLCTQQQSCCFHIFGTQPGCWFSKAHESTGPLVDYSAASNPFLCNIIIHFDNRMRLVHISSSVVRAISKTKVPHALPSCYGGFNSLNSTDQSQNS